MVAGSEWFRLHVEAVAGTCSVSAFIQILSRFEWEPIQFALITDEQACN